MNKIQAEAIVEANSNNTNKKLYNMLLQRGELEGDDVLLIEVLEQVLNIDEVRDATKDRIGNIIDNK